MSAYEILEGQRAFEENRGELEHDNERASIARVTEAILKRIAIRTRKISLYYRGILDEEMVAMENHIDESHGTISEGQQLLFL